MRISLVLVALALAVAPARADRTATFAVELGGASWEVGAIAAALRADLAGDTLKVPGPGVQPELMVRGQIAGGELAYTIARAGTAPVRGALVLAGLDRQKLAGILRDEMHRMVRPAEEVAEPAAVEAPDVVGGPLVALAALALLLAIPLALGAAWMKQRVLGLRGMRRLAVVVAGIAVLAYALAGHGDRIFELGSLGGWVYLAGGLAWGAFAAVGLPLAMPPLIGLHRVEHDELVPVLLAWLALALRRAIAFVAIVAPLGIALWLVGDALGLSPVLSIGVVAPLVALALRLAWRALAELLALRLDGELVDGDFTASQPWHPQVRAYFVGYQRRANVDVDETLLDRVRFLPGREAELAVYGGGLTHTRIVIPRPMLEQALAPYGRPHDYAMPRVSTLHWTDWNSGLVMPTEPGAKLASRDDRKPHPTVDEGEHERIAVGEPPTLSGIIEPNAFDPRRSYRPNEDPLWLDWDPGEEYDGTDAGDKDFLFGALVHAMGVVQRHEDRGATFGLVVASFRRSPRRPLRLLARMLAPLRRRSAALADAYVALNGARHHLAQYLGHLLWRERDDLATARAYVPELEQMSRKIVATLEAEAGQTTREERGKQVAALERRLHRLRPFVTRMPTPRSQRRKLALVFAALAGIGAVAALVVQSVLYHSTYEDRMKAEHERRDDGKRK